MGNYARNEMNGFPWISMCAIQSDCWLFSVACYKSVLLTKDQRCQLFRLINGLPSVYAVVKQKKEINYYDNINEMNVEDNCPLCKKMYSQDEFWIQWDKCNKWFHGKCARISSAKAEQLDEW